MTLKIFVGNIQEKNDKQLLFKLYNVVERASMHSHNRKKY